ncbi:VWA domain protein interacting with AAA ATPase [Bhargavaea cecembensis DSE10]|uniref:VWA domain protein interacting with AAA ATPase n=1 Tax=Bhargavaea cecembensis DSE10 TaxID=1235279 RepID=M7NFI9_9BACL|nr:VWA domain-containing protein [Bhargavaea cecembensis]EMR07298.1 VWA domain protein interacting with AAA ATPase [Bhargavaea cecembensis DSE10]
MRETKAEQNVSVLNTDAFDKRRFKEILEMSQGLRELRDEAVMPSFEPLLGDIWASLYKMKPALTDEEVTGSLAANKQVMQAIMADPSFESFRHFTRLNDWASAISTLKTGEKAHQWLVRQTEKDRILREQLRNVREQFNRQQDQPNPEALAESLEEFNEKLKQTIEFNLESFRQSMDQARDEAQQGGEWLKSLLGGSRAGSGDAELRKVPLRDKIYLAEKISTDRRLKEIADWAGRFKQTARKKQKAKQTESVARQGVTTGIDVENLLPVELSLYTHPMTKMDFLRRFSERQTMQFELKGPEPLNKGPIVICLDQSDSMRELDTQSKGFVLALMSIAKRQKRDLCLILFSSQVRQFEFSKGDIGASQIVKLAEAFLGGGTKFELALGEALEVIGESRFKEADLVFVTDGEDQVTDEFLERFNQLKREKAFQVLSMLIGTNPESVEPFTDRVVQVSDFNEEGSFTAFEV